MSDLYNYRAIFISADDANTIIADIDLGFSAWLYHEKLHLSGIDISMSRGQESSKLLAVKGCVRDWLNEGDVIEITTHKNDINQDGYWQAEVTMSDGRSLNQALLETDDTRPK